jgi:hypothetical protein
MTVEDILAGEPAGRHRKVWNAIDFYTFRKREVFQKAMRRLEISKWVAEEEALRRAAAAHWVQPPRASKASVNAAAAQIALNFTLRTLCNPESQRIE